MLAISQKESVTVTNTGSHTEPRGKHKHTSSINKFNSDHHQRLEARILAYSEVLSLSRRQLSLPLSLSPFLVSGTRSGLYSVISSNPFSWCSILPPPRQSALPPLQFLNIPPYSNQAVISLPRRSSHPRRSSESSIHSAAAYRYYYTTTATNRCTLSSNIHLNS